MNESSSLAPWAVSPEEVERRIEEYRRGGWEHKAPAQVVYHDGDQPCRWRGCPIRISGIHFQLEISPDSTLYSQVMSSWGHDPNFGVVGRCPECRNYVLFGLSAKTPIADPSTTNLPILPDDWHSNAYIG